MTIQKPKFDFPLSSESWLFQTTPIRITCATILENGTYVSMCSYKLFTGGTTCHYEVKCNTHSANGHIKQWEKAISLEEIDFDLEKLVRIYKTLINHFYHNPLVEKLLSYQYEPNDQTYLGLMKFFDAKGAKQYKEILNQIRNVRPYKISEPGFGFVFSWKDSNGNILIPKIVFDKLTGVKYPLSKTARVDLHRAVIAVFKEMSGKELMTYRNQLKSTLNNVVC